MCGCVYVVDFDILMLISVIKGEVSTLAGSADAGDANGNGNRARFTTPTGLWFDEKHQSLLVCDRWNNKLKRVSLKGMLNIAISFFSTRDSLHTSASFHMILSFFILAKFKQQVMYRQCVAYLVQDLWQLQTQLFSSQLRMAKSIESMKQVLPFSTFSLSASLHLSLSVSTSILLTHRSFTHPTFQGKQVYFDSMAKVKKQRNASSTTSWMALYWMRRPTLVSLSPGEITTALKRLHFNIFYFACLHLFCIRGRS